MIKCKPMYLSALVITAIVVFGSLAYAASLSIILPPTNTAAAAGMSHTVILKNDGTVWTCGSNLYGQLGNGTCSNLDVLTKVTGDIAGISIKAIAAGDYHTAALDISGNVWTWGKNSNGQLGDGKTSDSLVPTKVSGISSIIAITAAGEQTFALDINGDVWSWGNNVYGQLGYTTTGENSIAPAKVGISNVMEIAAGTNQTVAIDKSGNVWAWGSNRYCQLGKNFRASMSTTPIMIPGIPAGMPVKAASGANHNVIMCKDKSVWVWGCNLQKQLGNYTYSSTSSTLLIY